MRSLFLIIFLTNIHYLNAQIENSFDLRKKNLSININYDEGGFFTEGYFHYKTTSNYFGEFSANSLSMYNNRDSFYSLSLGSIRPISSEVSVVFGHTNYFDNNFELENEFFFGINYSFVSSIIYFDPVQKGISLQGIFNINSIFQNIPFELDFSITNDNSVTELFLNMEKVFKNSLFVGYIFSREQHEDFVEISYSKNGKTGIYPVEIIEQSYFNQFYIGIYF
jgi:hypothetical protein